MDKCRFLHALSRKRRRATRPARAAVAAGCALLAVSTMFVAPAMAAASDADARRQCVQWMLNGGDSVARAAEAALLGTDQDVAQFLAGGYAEALAYDERVEGEKVVTAGVPTTRAADTTALAESDADGHADLPALA